MVEVAADVGAGALASAGNFRGIVPAALGHARVRADEQQVSVAGIASYESAEARARYDYFFGHVAPFAQATVRHDHFEGLDLRLNLDPGLSYFFINDKTMRLQSDVGFDLQYDRPKDKAQKDETQSNARLFLGYEQTVHDSISVLTDVEYLPSFADLGTYRFVVNAGVRVYLTTHLALTMQYQARYENHPLPNVDRFDALTAVTLSWFWR